MRLALSLVLLGLVIGACRQAGSQNAAVKMAYAAPVLSPPSFIVRLFSAPRADAFACTGTFISQSQVLTAAHCLKNATDGGLFLDGASALASTKVYLDPELKRRIDAAGESPEAYLRRKAAGAAAGAYDLDSAPRDVAVLVFPAAANPNGVFARPAELAPGSESGGARELVGYGFGLTERRTLDGVLRSSRFARWSSDGSMLTVDRALGGAEGGYSMAGDSGGPWLVTAPGTTPVTPAEFKLVAITHGSDRVPGYRGFFVDLTNSSVKALLAAAEGSSGTAETGACKMFVGRALTPCNCLRVERRLCDAYAASPGLAPIGACRPFPASIRFQPGQDCTDAAGRAATSESDGSEVSDSESETE